MTSPLVDHYVTEDPEKAARVLEQTDAKIVCSMLEDMDDDLAARLLDHLLPTLAASCLSQLSTEKAAAMLTRLPNVSAKRLLARLDSRTQFELLKTLPEGHRQLLRHTLRYPEDSVGAVMLVDSPVCRGSSNVREVKRMIRRSASTGVPMVTVLDGNGRPIGSLAISELLRLREKEPISEYMRAVPARLRARAPLETILKRRAWQTEDYLPVIDTDDKFVGLLAKTAVYQHVLNRDLSGRRQGELTATVVALAELLWAPGVALLVNASTRRSGE